MRKFVCLWKCKFLIFSWIFLLQKKCQKTLCNVCLIKNRSKHNSNTLLRLLRIFMRQTLHSRPIHLWVFCKEKVLLKSYLPDLFSDETCLFSSSITSESSASDMVKKHGNLWIKNEKCFGFLIKICGYLGIFCIFWMYPFEGIKTSSNFNV